MTKVQTALSLAVSRALAEAELRRMKMSRRLSANDVAELLGSQADAAAASPLPYDQLLALALRAAARPGELESPELDALRAAPDPLHRHRIAREVFAAYQEAPYRAVLKAAPDWEIRRASRRVGKQPKDLAAWLRDAADLARELWDHPALPAPSAFRGAILAGVTSLHRRADELAPRVDAASPARALVVAGRI
jgi:hypothetical protein